MAASKRPGARDDILRDRDFRHLWAADALTQLGTRISMLAVPLLAVLTLHASAFEVSLLRTAETLAWLLFGLAAGTWMDRVSVARSWCSRPRPGRSVRLHTHRSSGRGGHHGSALRRPVIGRRLDGPVRRCPRHIPAPADLQRPPDRGQRGAWPPTPQSQPWPATGSAGIWFSGSPRRSRFCSTPSASAGQPSS
jgi:hypothetical protein